MKTTQDLNRELAQKLVDDALNDASAPYFGKCVGIANGQVVIAADNWDDVCRHLRQIESDPTNTFAVEVGRDYSVVQYI